MVKAILWDMDGVLVDTEEAHLEAWRRLYAERGETLSRDEFAKTFGMNNAPIIRGWLGDGLSDAEVREIGLRKEVYYREAIKGRVVLLSGVQKWLEHAQVQGYRQVVASSGEMANIVAVVEALGIANYFTALCSGAFLPASKPHPAIFLQAAAAAGAVPEDCLVIEDGTVGVEAARRAGIRCLALTTTHPAEKLADADRVADSLEQLGESVMDEMMGAWRRR